MNRKTEKCFAHADEHTPYGTMTGLAFKATGDESDRATNVQAAMRDLREWCMGRGNKEQAILAVTYLRGHCAKAKVFLIVIEQSFQCDEATDTEIIRKLCGPAYNGIIQRLSGEMF